MTEPIEQQGEAHVRLRPHLTRPDLFTGRFGEACGGERPILIENSKRASFVNPIKNGGPPSLSWTATRLGWYASSNSVSVASRNSREFIDSN